MCGDVDDDNDNDDDDNESDDDDNVGDDDIDKEPAKTIMVDGGVMPINGMLSYTLC